MPSRISMVKSSSYDLLVQYRFFVSCSGSHLHQSKSINIFYTGKTWAFSRRHLRQSKKKKKRKSREVRIEWEKRERSGSNGKKNGGLGRVEKGGRLKETLIRLNKERGLDRVKKKKKQGSLGRVEKKEGSLDRVEKWREVFEAWVASSRNPTQSFLLLFVLQLLSRSVLPIKRHCRAEKSHNRSFYPLGPFHNQ